MLIFVPLLQAVSILPTDASALESSISALERATSALEIEIKTLENSSALWEYSVYGFTFLVVVGVVMELWVIRHEWRDDMEAWALANFGVLRSPGRPSIAKLAVEIGSVVLIAVGVMGELGVGIKLTYINVQIRGKSAELRSRNAELRTASDRLVALLDLARVQLEKSMEWRHLSEVQTNAICPTFTPSGANESMVLSSPQDPEAWSYANEFAEELMKCQTSGGFAPSGHLGTQYWASSVPFGVWIRYSDSNNPTEPLLPVSKRRAMATSLKDKLNAVGISIEGLSTERPAGVAFPYLYVGPRFPPKYNAWLTISDEQFKLIRESLALLRSHALIVQANPNEADIWTFANRIAASLGMKATATVWPQGWIVPPGLTFSIGKNRQADFDAIVKALDDTGVVRAEVLKKQSNHKGVTDDDLILTVGPTQ